mmetsp:Transcript_5284/g.15951  ORF Transcript_5284/g.15951 Transcript_5284/m.15951 type:complete len:426 (+) Transcript_5284:664-1941(+)
MVVDLLGLPLRVRVVPLELVEAQVGLHPLLGDLGVVHREVGALVQQAVAHVDGGGLPGVPGILLEGKAQNGNLLSPHRVEQARDHNVHKPPLLQVVDRHHGLPVPRDLLQAKAPADVHHVQNVLLEARPAKADAGVQELGTDPRVRPDALGDLGHVRPCLLAKGGDGVDRRDPLGKEGVRGELGELRGPQVAGQDLLLRDPLGVHVLEGLDSLQAARGLPASDDDPVGVLEVLDGGALREELRVRQDVKTRAVVEDVVAQHPLHSLRGLDGHGRLLHDDLRGVRHLGDHPRSSLPVRHVRGVARADSPRLRRRVHADEHNVRLSDFLLALRGEEERLSPAGEDDLLETWLVDRQPVAVPSRDPFLVYVQHGHLDVLALVGDHGHGGTAHVTGADASDLQSHRASCVPFPLPLRPRRTRPRRVALL